MITLEDLKGGVRFVIQSLESLTSFKLAVGGAFAVEVKVTTRLGAIPVRGVKVTVGDEDFGASDADGLFKKDGAPRRQEIDAKALDIKATYENATEHLKKETVLVKLTEIDHAAGTQKCSATYQVPKVQDFAGENNDLDFKTVSDGTGELAWSDSDGKKLLTVTLKLATLSLNVPYISQNKGDDTVATVPGAAAGKDPEATSHSVKGPASGKFHGYYLCYPTSVTMLLNYWGVDKERSEVMQKAYDQWADKKFNKRLDKLATTTCGTTAPANPTAWQPWFDTTSDDGSGYPMKYAAYTVTWEEVTGAGLTAATKGKVAPLKPATGQIWKDTSTSPPVLKKATVGDFDEWKPEPTEDWRVDDSGSKIWEWGWRMEAVIGALKPAGATATGDPHLAADDLPLTKVESGDGALPADVLTKYKTWLKSGWPFVIATSATAGHMMCARGALVNKDEEIEWLIVNDPYGNLSYPGTVTAEASYQSAETNATGAIGETAKKGKSAYYHNKTFGKDNKLRIKGGGRGFPRVEKTLTAAELAAKLVPGA